MITEKDVMNSLPPEGFVKRYVSMQADRLPIPWLHLGTALTVLAPLPYQLWNAIRWST